MRHRTLALSLAGLTAFTVAHADQPIFNEMPRWDNGWGVQAVYEYRTEDDLLLKDDVIGPDFSEDVRILHLEGVYTWDKSIRVTVKIPYVLDASREVPDANGNKITQTDKGIGDPTLALPLKRYFNLDQRSGSWTIAPQVRIPLAGDSDYEIYDGEWAGGIGFGYETETYRYLFGAGLSAWHSFADEPFEASASLDVGINLRGAGSSGHLRLENDLHFEDDGSLTLAIGTAFYWRFTDTYHGRVSWHHDVIDRQGIPDHGNGNTIKAGFAVVF